MTISLKGISIFNVQSDQVRKSLFILVLIFSIALRAQTQSPLNNREALISHYLVNDSNLQQKWSQYKSSHLTFGYAYTNVGDADFFTTPLDIRLSRKLNTNVVASAASPSSYDFNTAFVNSDITKNQNAFFNNQGYGMYSKFEAGMMQTNDKKTLTVMGNMIFGVMSSMYSDQQSRQSSSSKQ